MAVYVNILLIYVKWGGVNRYILYLHPYSQGTPFIW